MDATVDDPATPSTDEPARPGLFGRLWQRRLTVALTFGVTLFLVIGFLDLLPVSYVATGSLIVADREPIVGTSSPAGAQKVGDPADVESTILLVRSPRLIRMLVAQPGIDGALEADCAGTAHQFINRFRGLDCARLVGEPEGRFHWAQDGFGVGAVGRSRVVSVSYRSSSPQVAQVMVNGLLQTFLADEHAKLRHSRDEAVDWVRQRLSELNGELQTDAAAIESYRTAHGLVGGVGGTLASERLAQAARQLSEAKAALADAQLRMQEAKGGAASRQVLDTRSIADLKQQLSQASALTSGAALRYGAQNPMLLAYRRQEAEIAARLAAETGRVSESARRNLDAAKQRVDQAALDLTAQTEAASRVTEAETQIASMVRDLEVKRGSYIDLSQRLSQLETERRLLEPSTQLVNMAELPQRPAFPQKTPFLIGGLALASILATTAGLLTYRPVVAGPLALGRTYTRIPILSQIPEMRLRRTSKKEVARRQGFPFAAAVSLLDSHPPLLESIRILHARLTLAGFGTKRRTLLVASEVAGEGKSFITMALARMAQASGRRVLVIETSLRRPFLEEALHGPPSNGLAGFLRNGGPIETIGLGALPGVEFLLAGDEMGDSTELLSGPRFRALLEWAERFDLVLIDSAPVSELMDAALLAPRVDGVLFCLRAGRPPANQALNSLPEMQRANNNVVGLALTFVPDDKIAARGVGQVRKIQPKRQLQPDNV